MNRKSPVLLLLLLLSLSSVSRAAATAPYLDHLDRAITGRPEGERLLAERYVRLTARLSVYAIYCDMGNHQGLNTDVYKLRQRTKSLQQRTENAFGGMQQAYNRFEDARNDESSRFKTFDQNRICADNRTAFDRWVRAATPDVTQQLSTTVFGGL